MSGCASRRPRRRSSGCSPVGARNWPPAASSSRPRGTTRPRGWRPTSACRSTRSACSTWTTCAGSWAGSASWTSATAREHDAAAPSRGWCRWSTAL